VRQLRAGIGLAVALAVGLALGLVPALAPVPVAAATPSLTLVGATTYDVLPDQGRVAASVRVTATNRLKDSVTRRFFFRTAFITVLPGTSGFKIAGGSGQAKVSISSATPEYTNLKIDLGANLAAGKSTTLTLTFDLKDPGGAPDRPMRVSTSLVSFAAWAVATPETAGASVDVRFPTGYDVTIGRGPLNGPVATDAGHQLWSSGTLANPLEFVADLSADRPVDYQETNLKVALSAGSAEVLLRAWPDDPAWRDRVSSLVERALPVLEREIGVPWPVEGPLAVQEALVKGSTGYAALFDPAERRLEVAYAASDGVVLHELAHAWFNGRLVADRWEAEAFASYYAELAAKELAIEPATPAPPKDPVAAAIALNAWGPSGSQSPASEAYAYAASLDLARTIAQRAGPDVLRSIWSKAAHGIGAYQPDPAGTEPAEGPPDWRGLLDLLEESAGKDFADLWRTTVARREDRKAIDDRAVTRGRYTQTIQRAGDWRLPPTIREAMRAWQFDVAGGLLAAADAVQTQRVKLESAAAAAGATLPGTMRTTFEGPGGIPAALAEATAEQATVDLIAKARATRPTPQAFGDQAVVAIGLVGSSADADLSRALASLAGGDLQASYAAAQAAQATWASASDVGRSRIVSLVLLLVAAVLFAVLYRQQRRRKTAGTGSEAGSIELEPPAAD
jgi:hypothetical protein